MHPPEVTQLTVSSFDGTSIAYQVCGQGPAVVLAKGLGGSYSTWRHQYHLLEGRYRVISWDYRGLYRSGRPARAETLALEHQVRDLEAILGQEQIERAVFVGWSMGVQFNFEYYRRHADQVVGLVALNGAAGHPFRTVGQGHFLLPRLVPVLARAMKMGSPIMNRGTQILAHWDGFVPLLQRLGMVAPTLDRDVFADLAREYATVDFDAYAETFLQLGHHDATDLLHRIQVPTLILAGTRDLFTPLTVAERMAAAIPDARLVVIEGGTHYAAVEYPREVNEHLRDFLKRIGYGDIP